MTPALRSDPPAVWQGRLILLPGGVAYFGRGGAADAHAHNAVQLVWAVEGSVTVEVRGRSFTSEAVLLPARKRHAFSSTGARVVILLVEPTWAPGAALHERATADRVDTLAKELGAIGCPDPAGSVDEAARWCRRALAQLTGTSEEISPLSEEIDRVVTAIEAGGVARLEEGASLAALSPDRLTHRFTEEVGMPFRRFVLWCRLKRAVAAVRDGADLTRAAAVAGFADSAHLSRTFRETVGLPPSRVLPFLEIAGGAWAHGGRALRP